MVLVLGLVLGDNNHPIFLLHGFMGWGKNELNDYYYWGGKFDLEKYLKENGFEVYTLSVGPVSSNWDRAIEAYYQIKGGQVDYGEEHSKKYNLIQKPEDSFFNGLYPQWNQQNPIHIIGHSQGGQTARMLEYILHNEFMSEESYLLKEKQNNWIKSITTISTPHNGTTLAPIIYNIFPYIQSTIVWLDIISPKMYFDFDLDQWSLSRFKNESLINYLNRIKQSPIKDTKNFSYWDLSVTGSKEFNGLYKTDSKTYYFTFATTNNNQPKLRYSIQSKLIQKNENFAQEWKENDGLVNTISMIGPQNAEIKDFDGEPEKGIWQFIGKVYLDHNEITGHNVNQTKLDVVKFLFLNHCELLYTLN